MSQFTVGNELPVKLFVDTFIVDGIELLLHILTIRVGTDWHGRRNFAGLRIRIRIILRCWIRIRSRETAHSRGSNWNPRGFSDPVVANPQHFDEEQDPDPHLSDADPQPWNFEYNYFWAASTFIFSSVTNPDPGSGAFLTPRSGSRIRDG